MKFNEKSLSAVESYLACPAEQDSIRALGSVYWNTVIENILEIIHTESDSETFFETEQDFLNYGILNTILENSDEIKSAIIAGTATCDHLALYTVTTWLKETQRRIYAGDKKELLEREIKNVQLQQKKITSEISTLQQARREALLKELPDAPDKNVMAQIENLNSADALNFQSMQTKREIAKGVFFSVENRRDFVARTNQLQKETVKNEAFISKVKSSGCKTAVRKINSQIGELFEKSLACMDAVAAKQKELETIAIDQSTLSVLDVENRIREDLEYLRDLAKLCAKRLHTESCALLRPKDRFFTLKEVCRCFDRIVEFDPKVLCNDRVSIFGKPYILMVPGNGCGLYDWKYNRFIIPLIPPAGDFMASVATAIIEYRLDVDDDKKLLASYQKLPAQKNERSMIALRSNLTKDYIKWMTSEYCGYKVLDKESRAWFEHEIAPGRIDIFCPLRYQPFIVSTKEFKDLLEATEKRLADSASSPLEEDLWAASIVYYQQGKFNDAFIRINELLARYPSHVFGYYNLGIIGMKIGHKQDALKGFEEFIRRSPQSWWTSAAKEHIRRLQIG